MNFPAPEPEKLAAQTVSAALPQIPPAAQSPTPPPLIHRPRRLKKRYIFAVVAVLLVALSAKAVAGYFFLGSESSALRKTVMARARGHCEKKFAVRLGWVTTQLVRYGSRFVNLPPEPRAVLDTLHRVEVGVYRLDDTDDHRLGGEILADTDATMKKRGWQRIVGVVHDSNTVAIYAPAKGLSRSNIECAVLVLNGHDLVVAAGSGNPMPLIELAAAKQSASGRHFFQN